jgi:hypothetical protein
MYLKGQQITSVKLAMMDILSTMELAVQHARCTNAAKV